MPLADMLSAMRSIILDGLPLPPTAELRAVLLQHSFPGLSTDEAEDLAQVDPRKFGIYTGTIFRGEAGLLQRLFPMSFVLLKQSWPKCFSEQFDPYNFTRELHSSHPWKSYATVGFADAFVAYVSSDLSPLLPLVPALPEIAQFELSSLRILRAISCVPAASIPIHEIQACTVAQLLALDLRRSTPTESLKLAFNCIDARTHYLHSLSLEQFSFTPTPGFAIGSRDNRNDLHWTKVPEAVYALLCNITAEETVGIEQLAVASLEGVQAESEEEKFQIFFNILTSLLNCGAIQIPNLQ